MMLMLLAYGSGPAVLAALWIRMAVVNAREKRLRVPADPDRNGEPLTKHELWAWLILADSFGDRVPQDAVMAERSAINRAKHAYGAGEA